MNILRFAILVAISAAILNATPDWFQDRSLIADKTFIGYGEDANLQNAVTLARADISNQLQTKVNSNISITQADHNGVISSDSVQQNDSTSASVLEESQIIKQSYQDGRWFVAVQYQELTQINRFVKKVEASKGSENITEHQNQYFVHTYLGMELNKKLGKMDIGLQRQAGEWYLNYKDIYQKIDINIPDLFITFSTTEANRLDIEKSSRFERIINDGEPVHFHPVSKKRYWSLFAMSPEGEVYVIEDNMPINMKPGNFNFRKKTGDTERPTMFVAVFSNSRIDNSYFRLMNGYESLDTYKNDKVRFNKFIEFLDDKEYVTKKMIIK
jgi:hypothetical protein